MFVGVHQIHRSTPIILIQVYEIFSVSPLGFQAQIGQTNVVTKPVRGGDLQAVQARTADFALLSFPISVRFRKGIALISKTRINVLPHRLTSCPAAAQPDDRY